MSVSCFELPEYFSLGKTDENASIQLQIEIRKHN